jgi:hypothetical protein
MFFRTSNAIGQSLAAGTAAGLTLLRGLLSFIAVFAGFHRAKTPLARTYVFHFRHDPFARSLPMDQDAVTERGVGQTVGLIDPAPHGAGVAFDFSGKKLDFEQIF